MLRGFRFENTKLSVKRMFSSYFYIVVKLTWTYRPHSQGIQLLQWYNDQKTESYTCL